MKNTCFRVILLSVSEIAGVFLATIVPKDQFIIYISVNTGGYQRKKEAENLFFVCCGQVSQGMFKFVYDDKWSPEVDDRLNDILF